MTDPSILDQFQNLIDQPESTSSESLEPTDPVSSQELNIDSDRVSTESEQPLEPISAVDMVETAEEPKNFCDISTENILKGGRTRSQVQRSCVLHKLRRVFLLFRLALKAKQSGKFSAKGYRSYK